MWKRLKVVALGSMVVMMATTTACGSTPKSSKLSAPTPNSPTQSGTGNTLTQSLSQSGSNVIQSGNVDAVLPLKVINNVNYVAASELIQTLKFQSDWDAANQKLLIGDNDANYELTVNTTKAMKDGSDIQVSQPFIKEGDTTYVPVSALSDLFQEDMSFEISKNQLKIHPSPVAPIESEDAADPSGTTNELGFGEDPQDPFKGAKKNESPVSGNLLLENELQVWSPLGQDQVVPVLKNVDINAMINKGEQYLGVKYKFGTGPYPETGKFDCSTFTQYVYGKYGIKLQRLARQQATQGTLVSRKTLRKGDLMFFYVPGRFKTNKTVGHVGIYIGNMQMLHASPEPKNGVQISNIDKAYWKATFLRAKRIVY
ncbi:hypothetical protein BC351_13025 [Paenibacillus ferrarius]|uniref:NlpC/P60 domain-containing protein n=1 Tax=Paenibacillus ferrarius TaxID=1469647 RepID=A0A1V4H6P0_9BACL|nr:C40 family peptidase [Paenibacillus ferrarius]OPH46853.1 hypothetical protein BC351_13025 [Paenibacillus ferrarius]